MLPAWSWYALLPPSARGAAGRYMLWLTACSGRAAEGCSADGCQVYSRHAAARAGATAGRHTLQGRVAKIEAPLVAVRSLDLRTKQRAAPNATQPSKLTVMDMFRRLHRGQGCCWDQQVPHMIGLCMTNANAHQPSVGKTNGPARTAGKAGHADVQRLATCSPAP
jgi:hypothetical protein